MSPHLLSTFACQNVSLAGFLISPLLTPISPEVCSVDCSIHNTRDIAAVQCCCEHHQGQAGTAGRSLQLREVEK